MNKQYLFLLSLFIVTTQCFGMDAPRQNRNTTAEEYFLQKITSQNMSAALREAPEDFFEKAMMTIEKDIFYLFNAVIKQAVKSILVRNVRDERGVSASGAALSYAMGSPLGDPTGKKARLLKAGLNESKTRYEALKMVRAFYTHWIDREHYKQKSTEKMKAVIRSFQEQIKEMIKES